MSETPQLPPSSDEKFWTADILREVYNPNVSGAQSHAPHGSYSLENGLIICNGCGNSHTMPLDTKKYAIVDGRIEKRA